MKEFFLRGGPIMWPLLICSLIALTVTFERAIFWLREKRRQNQNLVDSIFLHTERAQYASVVDQNMANPNAAVRVLLSGLAHREYGLAESMQVAAGDEIEKMKQGLPILDTIVTLAPLLGILGTVMGIIQSFDLLGASEIGDPRAVTGGIAQALITTATGLGIALVTLVPYNYFVSRVESTARSLEQLATQFEVAFKRGQEAQQKSSGVN
jgi:biopolymer transport protein ExbB